MRSITPTLPKSPAVVATTKSFMAIPPSIRAKDTALKAAER